MRCLVLQCGRLVLALGDVLCLDEGDAKRQYAQQQSTDQDNDGQALVMCIPKFRQRFEIDAPCAASDLDFRHARESRPAWRCFGVQKSVIVVQQVRPDKVFAIEDLEVERLQCLIPEDALKQLGRQEVTENKAGQGLAALLDGSYGSPAVVAGNKENETRP